MAAHMVTLANGSCRGLNALQSAQYTVTLQVAQYSKTSSLCLIVFLFVVLRE